MHTLSPHPYVAITLGTATKQYETDTWPIIGDTSYVAQWFAKTLNMLDMY